MTLRSSFLWAGLCLLLFQLMACGSSDYARKSASPNRSSAYGGNAPVSLTAAYDEGESDGDYYDDIAESPQAAPEPMMEMEKKEAPAAQPKAPPSKPNSDKTPAEVEVPKARLVIYNAQLGLFVFKMEDVLEKAKKLVEDNKGWVQQSTSSSMTLRVPAAKFEPLMTELGTLGDIQYRNITGTDVTEQFYDNQIRLKNAEALRLRYVQLLAQAKTVKDSLEIERELARITQEIELLKGKLRFFRDQIAFSTITLSLTPKTAEPVNVSRIPLPFGWMGDYNLDQALR